jgi:PAS domain S-box-containing protein
MHHSPMGMTLVALDGGFIAANAAFCDMLGYTEEELCSIGFAQVTHPDDLDEGLNHVEDLLAGRANSYRMRKRYLRKDGGELWAELSVALLRDDDGEPIHFISQILDISEQVAQAERLTQAHDTIDRQRRMAEAVYDSIDIGLVLIDSTGHYQSMNRSHGRFLTLAYPDGHDGQAGQLGAVYAADGTTYLPREEMPTVRATRGEEFDDVRMWVGSDPLTRRCLSVSARPVLDSEGVFVGAALAYKDVTDFMSAMEIKDQFVASVSHELRTPLTAVLGHLELLGERPDLPVDALTQIGVVERNAMRLGQLVSDLLSVAEGGMSVTRQRCDLVELVNDALEAASPLADAVGITLDVSIPHSLVAEVEGQPVGFALYFHTFSTFRGQPGLYLEDIFVRESHRRLGIGKALLTSLARIARERGCGRLEWSVLDWNTPAIEFYRSLGARPMDEWTVYRLDDDPLANLANGTPGSPQRQEELGGTRQD